MSSAKRRRFCHVLNLLTWVHVNNQHQSLVFTVIDILMPGDACENREIMVHVMASAPSHWLTSDFGSWERISNKVY